MYIEPNTNIKILHNVPLDTTYKHTIYFDSKSAQESYFASNVKYNLTKQSYQRKERGWMRIQINSESLYDCNYLMFQNTSFGNKWFYAFITDVEYINNEVSEVGFEIDVMQTWFFDVTLKESFVEREHSETDEFGENIIEEPLKVGEYYMGTPNPTGYFDSFDAVIVSPYVYAINETVDPWISNIRLKTIDNNPTVLSHVAFNSTNDTVETGTTSYLGNALSQFPDNDDIVCIYECPHDFITYESYDDYHTSLLNGESKVNTFTVEQEPPTKLCYNYEPKNKKLLTYPFNKLVIDTADGNTYEYMYEFFGSHYDGSELRHDISFEVKGYIGINSSFKAIPKYYKGESENFTEGCLLTDFPSVGFLTDSFKAWVAQNKTRLAVQTASAFMGIGSGLGTVAAGSSMLTPKTKVLSKPGARMMAQGYEQIANNGVNDIIGTLAEGIDRSALRYHPRVGSSDGSLEIKCEKKDFTAIQYSVNPQEALVIDDFFSTYGYATHRVKVPNRNVRPHWTYTKTINCNLIGNAPSDDVQKICSIYDDGITFWANGNEVGDYSLNNAPTT